MLQTKSRRNRSQLGTNRTCISFYFDGKSFYVPLGTRHLMLMESIEEVSEVDDIESTEAAVLSNIGSEENISDLVV